MIYNILSVVLLAVATQCAGLIGTANFKLTKLEPCDSSDYPIKVDATFRNGDDGVQYLTATNEYAVNFGEDSDYNVTIDMKKTKDDQKFSPVMTMYDESTCDAIKKYLGDFILDAQKAAGIEPGLCPIPKGKYLWKEYPLDFKKIAFQSVPAGILRARHVISNVKTKEVLMCLIAEIENLPK